MLLLLLGHDGQRHCRRCVRWERHRSVAENSHHVRLVRQGSGAWPRRRRLDHRRALHTSIASPAQVNAGPARRPPTDDDDDFSLTSYANGCCICWVSDHHVRAPTQLNQSAHILASGHAIHRVAPHFRAPGKRC